MPGKMVLFFNQGVAGFSETWYFASDDPLTFSGTIKNKLFQAAVKWRHVTVSLKAARFSRIGAPRLSYLKIPYPVAMGTRGGDYSQDQGGADPVSTTGVYRVTTGSGKDRRLWARGLADVDVRRDPFGNDVESNQVITMRDNYFSELIAAGLLIQYLKRPPDAGLVWKKIQGVYPMAVPSATRANFVTPPGDVGYPVGTVLSFNGIPSNLPNFPRQAEVISQQIIIASVYHEIAYRLPGGIAVSPQSMKATPITYGYEPIFDWSFERFGEHKTGRPFGSLRGRSRGVGALR